MIFRRTIWCVVALAISAYSLGGKAVQAQEHSHDHSHSDVTIHLHDGALDAELSAVAGKFGDGIDLPVYRADDPGIDFDATEVGVRLSFDMQPIEIEGTIQNLWYWDGIAPVTFDVSPVHLHVKHPEIPPSQILVAPLDAATTAGFEIGSAVEDPPGSGDFGVHKHLWFDLTDQSGNVNLTPPTGVFFWSTTFNTDAPGVDASEPVYWVMGRGVDEEVHESAHEWVESNLVPEPSSAALALAGILAVLAGCRRRVRRISCP